MGFNSLSVTYIANIFSVTCLLTMFILYFAMQKYLLLHVVSLSPVLYGFLNVYLV